MSCDCGTCSPQVREKSNSNPAHPRLPKCLFLGSHEDCVGELTLDASTLKEVWGDEPVTLALASMLKAVLEGRVSSEKPKEEADQDDAKKDDPPDDMLQARLALVEVFECFSAGITPGERPIHVLDIDSMRARLHELCEARKTRSANEDTAEASSSTSATTPSSSSPSSSSSSDVLEPETMTAEEDMLSVLLNIVSAIRKKHKLHSHSEVSPPSEGESGNDDNSLTFGIVDTDVSSSAKNDYEKERLLVCRETKKKKTPENGIYPIQSIYSFFLVLSSEDLTRSPSQSPSSDSSENQEEEDEETVSVSPEPEEAKDTPDKVESSSPQDSSKPSLFLAVKKHEENAWSVLAALHEEGYDTADEDDEDDEGASGDGQSHFRDVTVIVDPLRIIDEYIRYLQGEDAPPRTEQRKRRRVQVHESTVERSSCKIRILTPYDEDDDSLSPVVHQENQEQIVQGKMVSEQEELRKLLEQKLRELQQSIEQASQEEEDLLTNSTTSDPPPGAVAE